MATLTISFMLPSPAADSYRVGYRKKGTADAYTYVSVEESPAVLSGLEDNHDYEGTIESVCFGEFSVASPWSTDHYTSSWRVTDVWFDCTGEPCDGEAIFCNWFEVRRVSDNVLIFRYDHDDSGRIKMSSMLSLVDGVSYSLSAEWAADITKTNFGYTFLTGNSTSDAWEEVNGESAIRSIVFTGAADSNHISVSVSSEGALCSCAQSLVLVIMSSNLGNHCINPAFNVRVAGSATVLSEGMILYIDPSLSLPVQGDIYVSDTTGTIRHLDPVTGAVGLPTGEVCL